MEGGTFFDEGKGVVISTRSLAVLSAHQASSISAKLAAQIGGDALEDFGPIAGSRLPIQPEARIPRAVRPVAQPAKVGRMRQQYPGSLSQRTGEMS